ncbi:UNVERIFIED_CONTAM: hypothetical protein GTU68_050891 [Idotea baltica]|nr:hypothetical protein [Idotea baltica]
MMSQTTSRTRMALCLASAPAKRRLNILNMS